MRTLRQAVAAMLVAAVLLVLVLTAIAGARQHPQDVPWTKLDLGDPVGLFTARKLTALTTDFPQCRALLDRAGVRYATLPPVQEQRCGYADGVTFRSGGARRAAYRPTLGTSCAVAASLALWEWHSVQPEARTLLGSPVVGIDHLGSYNCRRIGSGEGGNWSEHATADAVDIAGFVLADGRRISVLEDWRGTGPEATFLHRVRNGACRLFATTLSPDYNAAHANHFHLDQATRGGMGWTVCR